MKHRIQFTCSACKANVDQDNWAAHQQWHLDGMGVPSPDQNALNLYLRFGEESLEFMQREHHYSLPELAVRILRAWRKAWDEAEQEMQETRRDLWHMAGRLASFLEREERDTAEWNAGTDAAAAHTELQTGTYINEQWTWGYLYEEFLLSGEAGNDVLHYTAAQYERKRLWEMAARCAALKDALEFFEEERTTAT